MHKYVCPVCGLKLFDETNCFKCEKGHSFDLAKEGYLNLLLVNRHTSKNPGDSPEMARARRDFLDRGYYLPQAEELAKTVSEFSQGGAVLDACCGNGYYTHIVSKKTGLETYGFDISKTMIRFAAKRGGNSNYFVSGINSVPLESKSFDTVLSVFSPFCEGEFARLLRNSGTVVCVTPGSEHLLGLKTLLYERVLQKPEKLPEVSLFTVEKTIRVKTEITVSPNQDIKNLFMMTPYYYKTSPEAATVLDELDEMKTTVDFLITVFRRSSCQF